MMDSPQRQSLLLVEGQTDLEFIGKLLRFLMPQMKRIKNPDELDPFWINFTKLSFPQNNDLTKRMEVPGFFQDAQNTVAIVPANSVRELVAAGNRVLSRLDTVQPHSIGFILDADTIEAPHQRFDSLLHQIAAAHDYPALPAACELGVPAGDAPRFGVYILPDCENSGTLEDLLIDCGASAYPHLTAVAQNYIGSIDVSQIPARDLKDWNKPAGPKKAQVSAMAAVLKPGKSIQVSLLDNQWVSQSSAALPGLSKLSEFLVDLLCIHPTIPSNHAN